MGLTRQLTLNTDHAQRPPFVTRIFYYSDKMFTIAFKQDAICGDQDILILFTYKKMVF